MMKGFRLGIGTDYQEEMEKEPRGNWKRGRNHDENWVAVFSGLTLEEQEGRRSAVSFSA